MSYLKINGIALKVARPGVAMEEAPVGVVFERAFSGQGRTSVRAFKRTWKGATPPMSHELRENVRQLLWGAGHAWSFDGESGTSHYSAKGLVGSGAGTGIGSAAPAPKYGTDRLQVNAGQLWAVTVPSSSAYTIMLWAWTGAAWAHYVVDSSGRKWVNGARNDAASTPFLVNLSTTTFSLLGVRPDGTLTTAYFDDVVYLPYSFADTTWPTQVAAAGEAFGALPRLNASGTRLPEGTVAVLGQPGSTKDVPGAAGVYEALEFTLEEA